MYEHEESVTKRLSALIRDYYWCTSMNDLQVLSPNLIPPQTREVHTVKLEAIEVKENGMNVIPRELITKKSRVNVLPKYWLT